MNLLKLNLFEDLNYSKKNHGDKTDYIILNGGEKFYRATLDISCTIKKGAYLFIQQRTPFEKDFLQENHILLDTFAKNKNCSLDPSLIFFRTLEEDNQKAYQILIKMDELS